MTFPVSLFIGLTLIAVPTPENGGPIELPKDPSEVVIEFAYKGGFTPPRKNALPNMTIRADGGITVSDPFSDAQAKDRLSQDELQELLAFIVNEQEFFEFDIKEVDKAVEAEKQRTGQFFAIADAPTTHIRVKTAERELEASYYALGFIVNQFKEIKALNQLHAVEERLNQLHSRTWAGGAEGVERFLELANAELKRQHPDVKPLTADELQYAGRRNGLATISFSRTGPKEGQFISAQIQEQAEGKPEINVTVQP